MHLSVAEFLQNLEHWNAYILGMRSVIARSMNKSWCTCKKRSAMPKAGPSPLEWKRRLEAFARGSMFSLLAKSLGKGQGGTETFVPVPHMARDQVCKCGYHNTSAKVSKYIFALYFMHNYIWLVLTQVFKANVVIAQPLISRSATLPGHSTSSSSH